LNPKEKKNLYKRFPNTMKTFQGEITVKNLNEFSKGLGYESKYYAINLGKIEDDNKKNKPTSEH